MGADDQQQELLGALEALGGSAGNGKLRDLLGWDEATYEAVKAPLITEGQLRPGRGRGGSVTLADGSADSSRAAGEGGSADGSTANGHQGLTPSPRPTRSMPAPAPGPQPTGKQNLSSFIWSVADLLRGDYKQSDYGKVILPFTVLRRLDCVLEPTKEAVLAEKEQRESQGLDPEQFLLRVAGQAFCNTSAMSMKRLMGDQDNIGENLRSYIQAFTPEVRDIFERFEFHLQVDRLEKAGLLYMITERFAQIDLHPETVSNAEMGLVFEELIRKFAELSNETAGEHFTPREVIRLMVNLIFIEDDQALTQPGIVRSLYDPTAGTGGMLSVAEEHLVGMNPSARLVLSGQELNPESYAICKADMLIKGQDIKNIRFGNTLSDDQLGDQRYDYMLSNPPFGVDWKKIEKDVRKEADLLGYEGRFGPGLPRVSDGALLFLLHLLSKMRPASAGGSRVGIILNGPAMVTGGAGSGESEIRRYVIESDLLEAVVALPPDMFYNTPIPTYVWILSNNKDSRRKGLIQLIDASRFFVPLRRNLNKKGKELSEQHISLITRLYGEFRDAHEADRLVSKILSNEDLGYTAITIEQPGKDFQGRLLRVQKGRGRGGLVPDPKLRETEKIPLRQNVDIFMESEVLPSKPMAWVDPGKSKIGYEIRFNRYFYKFPDPIQLHCIDSQLQETSAKAVELIGSLTKIAGNQECQEPSSPGAHQDFSQVSRYSGEEWIGQVPSHWQVVRLGALFKMVSDPGNDDLPILSVSIHSGISDREYGEDDLERKVARSEDKSKYQRVMPGDLVYNMMRAWQGAFGTATVEGMVSPAYIVARPLTSINTRYIEEVLRTPRAIEQMRIHSKGITDFRLRLYWDDFKNIKIPLPPSDEIESILGRIDDANAVSIESAKIIALVRERRSAVIAAAMAGELSALHALEG